MTMKTNFIQGGNYNAVDLNNQFEALFADGVINVTSGSLAVTALGAPNLSVNVAIGSCLKTGIFLNNDAIVNVPITANTSGYNRIDIIVADLDNNVMSAVSGTPSSSPTVPILTLNKIALAQVLVGNNVSVINTNNITDVRVDNGDTALISGIGWYKNKKTGLILQWGNGSCVASGNSNVTFSIAFPIVCFNVTLGIGAGNSTAPLAANSISTTNFQINNQDAYTRLFYYIAVGH